jgi:hypothetical protein|tara:strand:+ start:1028 stop:1231 length:204 start_codon:yes stop_codon:yes gene_type:complete
MIDLEKMIESDTDRCGNYVTVQYEFPFPEESVLQARRDEEMRFIMRKPMIAITYNSNNCQKGETNDK